MSTRMNWRNARLATKRSMSMKDEAEYRGNDAAARWIERASNPQKQKKSNRVSTSQPQVRT